VHVQRGFIGTGARPSSRRSLARRYLYCFCYFPLLKQFLPDARFDCLRNDPSQRDLFASQLANPLFRRLGRGLHLWELPA
jgi:hypothetical protein